MTKRLIALLLILLLPGTALAATDRTQGAARLPGISALLGQYRDGMTGKEVRALEGAPLTTGEDTVQNIISYYYEGWAAEGLAASDVSYSMWGDTDLVYMAYTSFASYARSEGDGGLYASLQDQLSMLLGKPVSSDLFETRWETPVGAAILAISEGGDYDPGSEHVSLTCEIGELPAEF